MNLQLDENNPEEAVSLLQVAGHDVRTVRDQGLRGHPDPDIARVCTRERRALVALDMGFADIIAYPPASSPGMIVLRVSNQSMMHVLAAIRRIIPTLSSKSVAGHLWIVEESRVRIR